MRLFFSILLLILFEACICAQPGIYSEMDVEIQSKFMEAQIHKYSGDIDKQIETLKELLMLDENNHASMYELARAYNKNDKIEDAVKYAEKAFELEKNEWYGLALVDALESQQEYTRATEVLKELITLNTDNYTFYHRLAFAQQIQGKGKEAISTFNDLERIQGITESTSKRKFEIYSNLNMEKEAIQELELLSTHFPNNVRLLNNLASYYAQIGKEKEALKTYQRVLNIDPSNSQANMAMVQQDIGNAKDDQYLNAITPLISNETIPLDAKIKELIPYVIQMSEDLEDASNKALMSNATKLVNLYPNEAKVYALKADVLYNLGDNKMALKNYLKALELNANIFSIWDKTLSIFYELKDFKSLDEYSFNAIDNFPNEFDAYFFRGLALSNLGMLEDFDDHIFEAGFVAGKINSNILKFNALKASHAISLNNSKEALNYIKELSTEGESLPYVFEIFGDVYAANDDISTAVKYWKAAYKDGNRSVKLKEKINQKKFIEE